MTRQQGMGPAVVVPLAAEIDLTNGERAYDRLYGALASGVAVVIADFTASRFCDCAALRRLLTVQRQAVAQGSQLRLVIPSGSRVRRVAVLTGLDGQFDIYPTVRAAAAWLKRPATSRQAS
jgi:anti-anti-sigma factor